MARFGHSAFEQPPPPGTFRFGETAGGFAQSLRDARRHAGVRGIEAQHLLRAGEFARGLLPGLLLGGQLLLLLRGKFALVFHNGFSLIL